MSQCSPNCPGLFINGHTDEVHRCDECQLFISDASAARCLDGFVTANAAALRKHVAAARLDTQALAQALLVELCETHPGVLYDDDEVTGSALVDTVSQLIADSAGLTAWLRTQVVKPRPG